MSIATLAYVDSPAMPLAAVATPIDTDPAGTHPRAREGAVGLPCHVHPPDLWFAQDPAEVEVAKSLCGPCPLRDACLAGALARGEPWGVWGGECFVDGVPVQRKRGRGRPRKVVNVA